MNEKISKFLVGLLAQIEHFNGQVEHRNTDKLPHFDWLARGNILAYVKSYAGNIENFASYTSHGSIINTGWSTPTEG